MKGKEITSPLQVSWLSCLGCHPLLTMSRLALWTLVWLFGLYLAPVKAVQIRRLSVPRWVQSGTEAVVLDCEYTYNENDLRLVVKWFFNDNLEPVYQWIPHLGIRNTFGVLDGRLDLNFEINKVDPYTRHRALRILNPTSDLSGKYTCLVTSLAGQDSLEQEMIVYVPPTSLDVSYFKTPTNDVNISCEATGLFPRPSLRLYRVSPSVQSPVIVQDVRTTFTTDSNRTFDINLSRQFHYWELSNDGTMAFECVVQIPGTNYVKSKRILYYADLEPQSSSVFPTSSRCTSLAFFLLSLSAAELWNS